METQRSRQPQYRYPRLIAVADILGTTRLNSRSARDVTMPKGLHTSIRRLGQCLYTGDRMRTQRVKPARHNVRAELMLTLGPADVKSKQAQTGEAMHAG